MRAPRPSLAWLLVVSPVVGCVTAKPKPAPVAMAKPSAPPPGPVIPFAFAPALHAPWGLRVARHRTLPAPPDSDSQSLHFDTEEDSLISVTRGPGGNYLLDETLARHVETKNGDPDPDPVMVALTGVPVGTRVSPDGLYRGAVNAAETVQKIARHWPGGNSGFQNLPPELFALELERDWRLGAEVYFTHPIRVGQPVYSLLSVSLPQLPGKYVAVAERFEAPVSHGDGTLQVTSTQEIFGRSDPRWAAAYAVLAPLMKSIEISDDEVLESFAGTGGETVGLRSLQVFSSSYQGHGVFPLVTARGSFPLRFSVEEIAGAIDPPVVPIDPSTTARRGAQLPAWAAR